MDITMDTLLRRLQFSPLYGPMSRDTVNRIIDAQLKHDRRTAARLKDAVDDLLQGRGLSPAWSRLLHDIVDAQLQNRKYFASRMWLSLEAASKALDALPRRRRNKASSTTYGKTIGAMHELDNRPANYGAIESMLRRDLIPDIPRGPLTYDIAARIIVRLHPRHSTDANREHYLRFLKSTATAFERDAPELFAMAQMRKLAGPIEDEHPGFCVIRDGAIHEEGMRVSYYQGEAYKIIAARFRPRTGAILREAEWLCDNLIDHDRAKGAQGAYLRYGALDAFLFLAPKLPPSGNGAKVVARAARALGRFREERRLLDPIDREVAAEGLDELRALTNPGRNAPSQSAYLSLPICVGSAALLAGQAAITSSF